MSYTRNAKQSSYMVFLPQNLLVQIRHFSNYIVGERTLEFAAPFWHGFLSCDETSFNTGPPVI